MSAAPLSKTQKRVLAQAARAAWEALTVERRRQAIQAASEATHDPLISESKVFTHWRHTEQHRATGCASLCRMHQADYLPTKLHFQMLEATGGTIEDAAPSRAAIHTMGRMATDGWRQAKHKLDEALADAGLHPAYAEKICQAQNRCSIAEASQNQLWRLFYTIRNRGKAKHGSYAS